MTKYFALALGVLIAASSAVPLRAAPQYGYGNNNNNNNNNRDSICVYQDTQYHGWEQCYAVGTNIPDLGNRNDNISSIRFRGRAIVTVFEDKNFRGNSLQFTSDVGDLTLQRLPGSNSWNDKIGSLKISPVSGNSGRGDNRDDRTQQAPPPSNGVCVYDRPDYRGRSECWRTGDAVPDLGRFQGWNDRISSIRVFGGASAVFYENGNFGGARISVNRDIPDLGRVRLGPRSNWDQQISALQVDRDDPRGRGRGRGRD